MPNSPRTHSEALEEQDGNWDTSAGGDNYEHSILPATRHNKALSGRSAYALAYHQDSITGGPTDHSGYSKTTWNLGYTGHKRPPPAPGSTSGEHIRKGGHRFLKPSAPRRCGATGVHRRTSATGALDTAGGWGP